MKKFYHSLAVLSSGYLIESERAWQQKINWRGNSAHGTRHYAGVRRFRGIGYFFANRAIARCAAMFFKVADSMALPTFPPSPSAASAQSSMHVSSREIWSLTWPQALMMLFNFLVGFTDVVVAGRIHPYLQGALGIITQCQMLLLVLGISLVNGGLAAISQALGARLPLRADRYVGLLFKLGGIFCALTLAIGYGCARLMFRLLEVPPEIFDLTHTLWLLFLPILPASYLTFITVAVFRAHKNVWIPLSSAVLVCLVNAMADFGFGLGWFGMPALGAQGIILASIISVTIGGLFNLVLQLHIEFCSMIS